MAVSIQNMCRTCMLHESEQHESLNNNKVQINITQMVSILTMPEESKEELCLMELLKTTAPQLNIEENDSLPKIVCLQCSEKIKDIYRFQQNSLCVEQKFYKMLEHDSKDPFEGYEAVDILKTELGNLEENSSQSHFILEENNEIAKNMESIENSSDLSVDSFWDESESDKKSGKIKSRSKKPKNPKPEKNELLDDKKLKALCDDDQGGDKLKPPLRKRTSKKKQIGAEQMYPCDKCNRKLRSQSSLKKHQEMHDKKGKQGNLDRTYKCKICNKVFTERSHLKEHSRTHIGDRPFLCSECGKAFSKAVGLKEHTLRHLNQNQFPCPDCPRAYNTRADLVKHTYSTHQALPKKYICDVCERGFTQPYLLKHHKMYHNNDKPFSCEYCEKSFVTNHKLKRHTLTHTGEKPYKCKYCEQAYNQSNELIKHLRCHLGENVYQCEICPQRFPTAKILRKHFPTHKNDSEEIRNRNLAELNAMEVKGIFFKHKFSAS